MRVGILVAEYAYVVSDNWRKFAERTLRYFYAANGSLTAREINGVYQELVTDEKGQLTAVKDRDGNVLERYVYDPVGNLLEKVVRGRSTKYEYDAANQLVAQTTDAGTPQEKRVEFAYDGAGRMTREGQREYRYGGLDKVTWQQF